MDTTTISGLLSVKPKNKPIVGETRTFVVENRPAKGEKKAWVKIKHEGEDFGGKPYRILSAEPTGFTDSHGNISFNVEIEASMMKESRNDEIRAKGDSFHEPLPEHMQNAPESSVQPQNGKLRGYAAHSGKIFALAWEQSKEAMALIPVKDAEELSAFEWLDLRLRIAQGFTIEINKIIRKERF